MNKKRKSEQNKIIREKLGKNIVIQGVAGSGKTTVVNSSEE